MTLYIVQRCKSKEGHEVYDTAHASEDGNTTLCGKMIDNMYYITNNTSDGTATCRACLKASNGDDSVLT